MTYTKQETANSVNHIIIVHSGMYGKTDLRGFHSCKKWLVRNARKEIIELRQKIKDRQKDIRHYGQEAKAYERVLKQIEKQEQQTKRRLRQ